MACNFTGIKKIDLSLMILEIFSEQQQVLIIRSFLFKETNVKRSGSNVMKQGTGMRGTTWGVAGPSFRPGRTTPGTSDLSYMIHLACQTELSQHLKTQAFGKSFLE